MVKLVDVVKYEYTPATVISLTDCTSPTCVAYKLVQTKPLILNYMGKGELFVNPAMETPSLTWYMNYSNKNNLTDLNLDTYAYIAVTNTEYADVVLADYGSVKKRILYFRVGASGSGIYHKFLVSLDGSSWTDLTEITTTSPVSYVGIAECRYAKIQVKQSGSTWYSYLYELTAFDATNCVLYKNISLKDKNVIEELTEDVYFIFVNPTPALSFSAFSKVVPTTLKGVIVQ